MFSKIEDVGFSDPNVGNQHQVPMEMFVYSKNMYNRPGYFGARYHRERDKFYPISQYSLIY